MRILTLAIVGLALMTAGCASKPATTPRPPLRHNRVPPRHRPRRARSATASTSGPPWSNAEEGWSASRSYSAGTGAAACPLDSSRSDSRTICQRAGNAECGHGGGDDEVRPAGACPEDAQRSQHDGDVADRVVARADPHGPHVGVAGAEPVEQQRHADIGQQRQHADHAHHASGGDRAGIDVPAGDREHRDRQNPEADSLQQGGAGAPSQAEPGDPEADRVVRRIARKSSASACSDDEPAATPAAISAANMAALTASAIHSARRQARLFRLTAEGPWSW